MIDLTTPPAVNSVLGSSATIDYDKFVATQITYKTNGQTIEGNVEITSTVNPEMSPIQGFFKASVGDSELIIQVNQLDFRRRIVLSGPQASNLLNQIQTSQDTIESAFINLGAVDGTQSTGV